MERLFRQAHLRGEGFSLIEVIISLAIITIGVLSLAGTLALSVINSDRSRQVTLAKYIATSTVETIIAARETGVITFNQIAIRGSNPAGVFLATPTGLQGFPVRDAGPDRIYGTADDAGPDNVPNTSDDPPDLIYTLGPEIGPGNSRTTFGTNNETVNLTQLGYRRQISITDLEVGPTGPRLKRIDVEVFYPLPIGNQRSFRLTTILGNYRLTP
ncbi:MAG: prepilin-type N-terminal cleavage/methylation domain-containing protein [Acidobacteriota bacterium]